RLISTNAIHSMNTTWPSRKWKLHSSKARRPEGGGCNYPIRNTSRAAIKITCLQAATKFPSGGFAHRNDSDKKLNTSNGDTHRHLQLWNEWQTLSCPIHSSSSRL